MGGTRVEDTEVSVAVSSGLPLGNESPVSPSKTPGDQIIQEFADIMLPPQLSIARALVATVEAVPPGWQLAG